MAKRHHGPPQDDALDRIARALRSCQEAARREHPVEAKALFGEALGIAEQAIEARDKEQERVWRYQIQRDEPEHNDDEDDDTPPARNPRQAEQARQRLFALAKPAVLLEPANIVTVYLGARDMWPSWSWADTRDVNLPMLDFLQRLDSDDPLPADEPGVAVPMTAAGFFLYRALHQAPGPNLTADVYREIADGVVMVDKLFADAADRKLRGDLSAEAFGRVAHVVDTAHLLLLHAVRVGLDAWGQTPPLIRRCELGPACKRGRPFYVNRPGALRSRNDAHAGCRKAAERARTKAPASVTTIGRTAKR